MTLDVPWMLGLSESTATGAVSPFAAPALTVALCVIAAVGTMIALPGRSKTNALRIAGAGMMGIAFLTIAILLIVWAGKSLGSISYAYFWLFATVSLICAARVITHRLPVYSALYFVITVFSTAGLFVLMWAEFLAAALVIIYAGAILVTYTFVIMLASEASGKGMISKLAGGEADLPDHDGVAREPVVACLTGFGVLGVLLFAIFERAGGLASYGSIGDSPAMTQTGSIQDLAVYLFSEQLVSMQVAGLILTLAMVGAIMIARKRVMFADDERLAYEAETVVGPATPVDDNPHSITVSGEAGPRAKRPEPELASLD
jgi:NADH:ubiquinone oxidoreductase subunit 6 (subunit J)